MAWNDIKDPESIKLAIAECDKLGREEFLAKYGFRHAREYFLLHKGQEYDSKAILGVAHKFEFPKKGALGPNDLNGGKRTVKKLLERLGFEMDGGQDAQKTNTKKPPKMKRQADNEDEEFDPKDLKDGRERILAQIAARRGQGPFRRAVLEAYGSICAVTGCTIAAALEAAHIVPYLGEDTNCITNGILLRSDIHTLFDLGLIQIEPDRFTIRIESQLDDSEYANLNGRKISLPADTAKRPSKKALEWRQIEFGSV